LQSTSGKKRRQLFCCNNFWFLSVESSNFSQYILPSKTVVFFCFCGSGCKTGDNSAVALLNTHSLEKRNHIVAEGNRNDGTKQFNHPSTILKFKGEPIYK